MLPTIDFGFVQLPTFFIVLSLIMGLVFYLTAKRSRKMHIDERMSLDLALVLTVGGMVGARLFHILFENWDYYLSTPIKVFYFWEGGFVFYGGFILSFASGITFLYLKKKITYLKFFMQLFTPVLSACYMIGRLGCFLEGCCYGKFCNLPWAVAGRHPTQIYSSLWELGTLVFLLNYERNHEKKLQASPERLFFFWLAFHSFGRGLIEFLRDDFRGNSPLVSLSTWISGVLIVTAGVYFYRSRSSGV